MVVVFVGITLIGRLVLVRIPFLLVGDVIIFLNNPFGVAVTLVFFRNLSLVQRENTSRDGVLLL